MIVKTKFGKSVTTRCDIVSTLVPPVLRFANANPYASERTSAHTKEIASLVHLGVRVNPSPGRVRIDLAPMVPKSRLLFEPTEKKCR